VSAARSSQKPPLALVRDAPEDPADVDAALVRRLREGDPRAPADLFDRHGPLVNRILRRVLGGGGDHDDRVQETFIEVLRSIGSLRDERALRPWVTTITARVARAELRRRKLRRVFFLDDPGDVSEPPCHDDHAAREAVRATYKILDTLSTDDRLAFTLRFIHGEELTVVAEACGCSLATIKRRLAHAEARFVAAARRHPELARRIAEGDRWSPP